MIKKPVNTAPIIKVKKPSVPPPLKPEQKYPVGSKVYAVLRGGEKDGQVIEAEVQGHGDDSVLITYEREDGVSAIEPVSILDIRGKVGQTIKISPTISVGEAGRDTLTQRFAVSEEEKERYSTKPEILDGLGAESLKEIIKIFKLTSGDTVAASTDKGRNYKDKNEDRVLVVPKSNMVTVFDGMGGHGEGDKAAGICAQAFLDSPNDAEQAFNSAALALAMANVRKEIGSKAGSCFMRAEIIKENKQKLLDVSQAGDVKLAVYDKDGNIKFESEDQSLVHTFMLAGTMTPDQAFYAPQRNIVMNAIIMSKDADDLKKYPHRIPLDKGDRIVMASDGIWDNLTSDEIWNLIDGKTAEKAIEEISDITDKRMLDGGEIIAETARRGGREQSPMYSDGFKTEPKPDNRAIAIVDIN